MNVTLAVSAVQKYGNLTFGASTQLLHVEIFLDEEAYQDCSVRGLIQIKYCLL